MKYKTSKKNITINLKDIHPNIKNPRKGQYDKTDLEELKENMEVMGQITNIKIDENGTILSGHRRYQSAIELGWKTLKADVMVGLTEFGKSSIMISDNSTQREFNHWEARKAIQDIYWNEFCEEYKFKGNNDKGYGEFARRLGISVTQVRRIIEAGQKDNLNIGRKLEKAGIGTEIYDAILGTPKKYREEVTRKALELKSQGHGSGMREKLRTFRKKLSAKDIKKELHPSFFSTVFYKLESIGILLTKDVVKKTNVNDLIRLKESIEKNILPAYNLIKKNC